VILFLSLLLSLTVQTPLAIPSNLRVEQVILHPPPPVAVTWTLQTPNGTYPGRAGYLTLPWDPISHQTLFYAIVPASNSIYASDVYFYTATTNQFVHLGGNGTLVTSCPANTSTWPGDRHPEQMAIDTTRSRLYLFSGVCSGTNRQDMWYLALNSDPSLDTWHQVTIATVPLADPGTEMVYDATYDVIFLFGTDSGGQVNDHYVFCPTNAGTLSANQITAGCATADDWTRIEPANGNTIGTHFPAGVAYPGLLPLGSGKVLMYGGQDGALTHQTDTWEYTIATRLWAKLNPSTHPPISLNVASGTPAWAYKASTGEVFYQQPNNTGAPKTWRYLRSTNTWAVVASTGGGPASEAYMAYDVLTNRLIAFCRNPDSGEMDLWQGVLQ
jgi:hypothetical protein